MRHFTSRVCVWLFFNANLVTYLQRMFPKDVLCEKDKFGNSNLLNLS